MTSAASSSSSSSNRRRLRRVHEDLVDAAGFGRDVHRAEVVDDEAGLPVEGVGFDDPRLPVPAVLDDVERESIGSS
jgi:hypothetical protein